MYSKRKLSSVIKYISLLVCSLTLSKILILHSENSIGEYISAWFFGIIVLIIFILNRAGKIKLSKQLVKKQVNISLAAYTLFTSFLAYLFIFSLRPDRDAGHALNIMLSAFMATVIGGSVLFGLLYIKKDKLSFLKKVSISFAVFFIFLFLTSLAFGVLEKLPSGLSESMYVLLICFMWLIVFFLIVIISMIIISQWLLWFFYSRKVQIISLIIAITILLLIWQDIELSLFVPSFLLNL